MTLLCKFAINSTVLQRSRHIYAGLSRKCCLQEYIPWVEHLPRRRYLLTILRYQTTKTLKTKVVDVPIQTITKSNSKKSELKRLIVLAAPEKWRLVGAIVFLIVSSVVTMAVPFCIGKVIDTIYTIDKEKTKENLKQLSLALLGVFFVGAVCNFGRVYFMSVAGHRITQALRRKVYAAILNQETAMFDKRSTGELVGRLTGDAQLVSSAVTSNISDGLRSAIMTAGGVSMMLYVSPQLALISLSVVPPVAGMAILYGRIVKRISKDIQDNLAKLSSTAEEKISNIRTVKAFAQESNELKKYSYQLQDLLLLCYKESLYKGVFFGLTGFSGNAIVLFVLYFGSVMVSDCTITVGNLSAFLLYAAYIGISLGGLTNFYSELNKALGASTRLFELITRQPKIPVEGGKILEKSLSGDIIFQDVSFSYPARQESWILKNFSLHIPKCSMTAIVGPSGSGKSTIALLLLRLYDPNSGCVLLDNSDLKELDPIWVKSQMGMVSQEPTLFSGTIRENIIYGTENVAEDDLKHAARQAHVLDFVEKMTKGLDTVVGEKGIALSGGQRQRIAIARALIKNPKILILDEATSALDSESEHFVQQALERVTHGRTVLTIAHRLSTIKNADRIAVLDHGQIIETGTYDELMNLENGLFRKLVKRQTFA